jgi:hypothetical protein
MEKKIPDNIMATSIILDKSGISGIAFSKKDILDFLKGNDIDGFAMLGGDVLKFNTEKNKYVYTYDNWYAPDRLIKESFSDFCERCKQSSIEYIEKYPNDEGIVYTPVITSEITAGM